MSKSSNLVVPFPFNFTCQAVLKCLYFTTSCAARRRRVLHEYALQPETRHYYYFYFFWERSDFKASVSPLSSFMSLPIINQHDCKQSHCTWAANSPPCTLCLHFRATCFAFGAFTTPVGPSGCPSILRVRIQHNP